jgi:hypothetical protein
MISVGHMAPGAEIVVSVKFAIALSKAGERITMRIPTTVGDIYGSSGLSESDDLVHGGPAATARLNVKCTQGRPTLRTGRLSENTAEVPLNRPIDIDIEDWTPDTLVGRAHDGTRITLDIKPSRAEDTSIDAAILVDRSYSMTDPCADLGGLNKHSATILGLSEAGQHVMKGDRLSLWQFNFEADFIGPANRENWGETLNLFSAPEGGTEIGRAIDAVLERSPPPDVVLITDGKSHALDVHRLASTGTRFTVVLIGEDSLEANVGHLAQLSGGEIFIADGPAIATALESALLSLRRPPANLYREPESEPVSLCVRRGGMMIAAAWHGSGRETIAQGHDRAVAAYTAGLRLVSMPEARAVELAQSEGLVTHLTSLVLVDEEAESVDALPVTRKVPLPTPCAAPVPISRSGIAGDIMFALGPCAVASPSPAPRRRDDSRSRPSQDPHFPSETIPGEKASAAYLMRHRIDWKIAAPALQSGGLQSVPHDVAEAIRTEAGRAEVAALAQKLGKPAVALVAAIIAATVRGDRHAERLARKVLAGADLQEIATVAALLGIDAMPDLAPVPWRSVSDGDLQENT